MPYADSYLRCTVCGRESTTSFAHSLRAGWEKCCGYTMRLEQTDADIGAAVDEAFAPLRKLDVELRQQGVISERVGRNIIDKALSE